MKTRLLGRKTGLQVSPIALGTGRLGLEGRNVNEVAARQTVDAFLDSGGNLIDTSSRYLGGRAESIVGEAIAGRRDEIVVISKYGRTPNPNPAIASVGQHRKGLRTELEGSLRRLGTDYVDVLIAHTDDGVTPIEEVMYGMDAMVREGKALYVGLSSPPAWRAARAATIADLRGWAPLALIQQHYNLLERNSERECWQLADALGIQKMSWSPLGGGLLSGAVPLRYEVTAEHASYNRVAAEGGPQSPEGMVVKDDQAQEIVDTVVEIAKDLGVEPVTVAIAWVLSKDAIASIGPRRIEELAANVAAVDLVLSDEHLARLDQVSSRPIGYPYDMLIHDRAELGIDIDDPRTLSVA